MLRGSQKSGTAQFMEGEGVEPGEKHNGRNVIKPGSTPSAARAPFIYHIKPSPIFFRILPPRFFPDPIPILIIHLFVCYTPRQGDVFVWSLLVFAKTVFDLIVIPYLSVLRPPLNTTLGEPITNSAKQLTSQEMNQQLIPTYLSIYWGGFPLPGEATARC